MYFLHISKVCVLVFLAFIASCSQTNIDDNSEVTPSPINFSTFEQNRSKIINSWNWERTTYYFTRYGYPITETPISTGNHQKLIVKNDSTLQLYSDNNILWEKTISEYLDGKMWGIRNDTLAVSSAHLDGPEYIYTLID